MADHECRVIFHLKTAFEFPHHNASEFNEDKQYQFWASVSRTKLQILNEKGDVVCWVPTKKIESSPLKHGSKSITVQQVGGEDGQKVRIATFYGSSELLDSIAEKTLKTIKSCLAFAPSNVQHVSILSGESREQKYRGFLNLIGVMFLILNLRNILDNFIKYGIQFKQDPGDFVPLHTVLATCSVMIFPFIALLIEKLRFRYNLDATAKLLSGLNCINILVMNIAYCLNFEIPPFVAIFFTALCIVFFLKLISFCQVNNQLYSIMSRFTARSPTSKKTESEEQMDMQFTKCEISTINLQIVRRYQHDWQSIVSIRKLMYFIFAPTLCYQLEYPKMPSIRRLWLLKRIVEVLLVSGLQVVLWFQYIEPELASLFNILSRENYTLLELLDKHLKMAVTDTIMWIAGFYNFFHLLLNIIAEVTYFGDRQFYLDWWNCRTLEEYWKTWNLPVHFFFIRHVYNPILQKGYSKIVANFIVFFLSAVAHEYVVSVPLRLLTWWAFAAMMSQVPVIIIQKKLSLKNSELGNVSFWLFFCFVGQPIVVFIYYALYIRNTYVGTAFNTVIPLDIPINLKMYDFDL